MTEENTNLDNLDMLDEEVQAIESEASAIENELQQEAAAAQMSEADKEAARQGAMMAVGFLEQIVKAKMPMVEYSDDQRIQLRDKIAPVMVKYGAGLPEWMTPYKEEIELGVCLGTMAFTTYLQYQAWQTQQRILEAQAKRQQAGGQPYGDARQAG